MSVEMHECASLIKLVYEHYKKPSDLEKAVKLASYDVYALIRANPPGLDPRSAIFGVSVRRGNTMLYAFRGTDGLDDWLTNVDMDQNSSGIHSGFAELQLQMAEYLRYVASFTSGLNVVITGHSLGGALAVLTALTLSHLAPRVITFGAPRIGDVAFASRTNSVVQVQRVFNTEDVVASLPVPVTPIHTYCHSGTPIPFTKNTGSITGNHSIDLYIEQAKYL